MTYAEILEQARKNMGGFCNACKECNGAACRNRIPGPGAKGTGEVFLRNHQKIQEVKINMDTIFPEGETDTSVELFGRTFRYPFFAAPIGAMKIHYGDLHDDLSYDKELVAGCAESGIAAFTGDGVDPVVFDGALGWIQNAGGAGVPTIKPWGTELVLEKIRKAEAAGAMALAMDVDASGLALLKNVPTPVGPKSAEQLREIISSTELPFVLKGIMTVRGAQKALEAGAYGIVVSNHGGRVLDQTPSTIEVLPEIADAVGGRMKIFIDGGFRTGLDVFKALALGADAVLIGRPFVTAVYGGGAQGAGVYAQKVGAELAETMAMTGAVTLQDIGPDMVRISR